MPLRIACLIHLRQHSKLPYDNARCYQLSISIKARCALINNNNLKSDRKKEREREISGREKGNKVKSQSGFDTTVNLSRRINHMYGEPRSRDV